MCSFCVQQENSTSIDGHTFFIQKNNSVALFQILKSLQPLLRFDKEVKDELTRKFNLNWNEEKHTFWHTDFRCQIKTYDPAMPLYHIHFPQSYESESAYLLKLKFTSAHALSAFQTLLPASLNPPLISQTGDGADDNLLKLKSGAEGKSCLETILTVISNHYNLGSEDRDIFRMHCPHAEFIFIPDLLAEAKNDFTEALKLAKDKQQSN